jgi:tRNA (Thr-GGU) A37 N-methylase
MRGIPARLMLEARYAQAAAQIKPGDYLWVIYHLHQVHSGDAVFDDLFSRRIVPRPNPIGLTLVQAIEVSGTEITVLGLDSIDGTPILDLKPYTPVFDTPPVTPDGMDLAGTPRKRLHRIWEQLRRRVRPATHSTEAESASGVLPTRPVIALTGGPGGGKSTLLQDLHRDPTWAGRFVCLPEAVQYARFAGVSPQDKLFQRLVVHLQIGLEDGLDRALGPDDLRPILCHRGSLDPLAFWRLRGWPATEFYAFTGISRREHFQRYKAVIHLVTAAEGVPHEYTRWPRAHRPEELEEAVQLDRWLGEAWSKHPAYYRLDNIGCDWETKSWEAKKVLTNVITKRLT